MLYEGGYYGTDGIVHTGLGPFRLESGSYMAYGRVAYSKGALRISAFGNFLDASAPNLLVSDPNTLGPIILAFKTQTYDLEIGNTNVLGGHHIFTYGGNVRQNNFDISLAQGDDRTELGAYLHWEYFVDKFRFAVGGRVDKFGNIDDPVFSPRVSVMFKPTPTHSIRASYNKAFVSPSFINNNLDQNIQFPTPVNLTPLRPALPPPLQPLVPPPFLLTVNAFGNRDMREQVTDAYEVAYTGTFGGKTTVGLAAYLADSDDNINFTYIFPPGTPGYPPPTYYSAANPAKGVTVPTPTTPATPITLSPILMQILATLPPQVGGPILLPEKAATYLNLGPIRNRGIEASVDHRFNDAWTAFANYSWQDTPEILDADSGQIPYPVQEVGIPSEHRVNAGLGYWGKTFFGNANVNYASEALWVDVLNATYAGFTESYTMLNATVGMRFAEGKVTVSLKGINLTNEKIQQHIFGDILKRSVVAEVRFFTK
jgi:outer membrane receptor protein involved in Fe transport